MHSEKKKKGASKNELHENKFLIGGCECGGRGTSNVKPPNTYMVCSCPVGSMQNGTMLFTSTRWRLDPLVIVRVVEVHHGSE